jgi:hypothetical protein
MHFFNKTQEPKLPMKSYVLFFMLFGLSTLSSAQADLSADKVHELQELKSNLEGTFQIQMIDSRALPTIELSLFEEIQNKRSQIDDTFIELSANSRVFIPSFQEIESSSFEPLEYVSYLQSTF